jgi:Pentapeptide repeats (8 copies)
VGGAVLVGVLFTWHQQQSTSRQFAEQLAVTRQGQVGERFSGAVEQLGHDSIDVRLGGLYELEQLARPETQAPERRLVIMEVIAAYIRQHAEPPGTEIPTGPITYRLAQDVAAAFSIIGRRSIQDGDPMADLSKLRLGSANLTGARLDHVDLSDTDLRGAVLDGASLERSSLERADLERARLRGANLSSATLSDTLLRGARLFGANLSNANLYNASLDGADLRETDLRGADLSHAFLASTIEGVDLGGADLQGALANQLTRWPDGFDWQSAGVRQDR